MIDLETFNFMTLFYDETLLLLLLLGSAPNIVVMF